MENEKKKFLEWKYFSIVLLCIGFLITVICIATGSYIQTMENVQIGSVATQRYVALKDEVDTVATEKKKAEAAATVGPLYKHDLEIEQQSISEVEGFFKRLDEMQGTLKQGESLSNAIKNTSLKLPVVLSVRQYSAYQVLNQQDRLEFQKSCIDIINSIYEQGVTAEAVEKSREQISTSLQQTQWNSELQEMGMAVLNSALKANLVLDTDAMQLAKQKKEDEVEDIIIKKNQKIVDEGEIVTAEIYHKLESMNLINTENVTETILPVFSSIIVVLLIFASVFLFFYSSNKKWHSLKKNEMVILFTIYIIVVLLLRVMSEVPYFTLIPLSVFPMLVSLLISRRVALLLNCFVSIIGCFVFNGDVEFLLYFLLTGEFAALIMRYAEKRKYVFPVAVCVAIINFISMMAVGLFFEKGYSEGLLYSSFYGAAAGLIAVILSIGSLPFWEAIFEANTPLRLLELTNPNNELLRRLMIEAPGTYHHSLIVANLAETAAYEIDANAALARVGAYYHDIGKLKSPLYFSENQAGENPHDQMEPYSSTQIITAHTTEGVKMAKEKGLPKAIINIIQEHHGNSLVKFFYYKALKQYGADNVKEQDYRYNSSIPQSREAAIVMMADTVEAAVRSMVGQGKSLDDVEEFIKTLIKDKLDDGQLDKSGLAISDLETIRKSFLEVFKGMYHNRVAYPKKEEMDAAKKQKKGEQEENKA
ncbi:HDIG domain-containing metalloprotein [Clostridium sp. MD294]|uniref:HD family phosphohydrolase n=1 Tax=Clostridium sp. MD294 TaxID=97138 RepID=UPI0002C915F6|nr:HDIG domain-containing metalloprotein [Clostridium sp. MD294]NDO47396.1 HDIG domain-containing protein [Clostridium sp. MD294]USF29534.1 Cyclic-di-AMP phosphodiesterase PgpH [Clostridium sp. MD294]